MRDTADGREQTLTDARLGAAAETLQLFSHDIRSAMSDVVGGLRLVDRSRLDPEARMQVDRVQAAGDTLAALVDAALMAAAGETLIKADDPAIPTRQWINALSDRWSGRARESQNSFSVAIDGALPNLILVPQITLDRIVGNLVGNAFSHAQGAAVALRISAQPGAGLDIVITDAGPGYPDAVLQRMLAGVDVLPIGRRAGSGLGLRIAAELSQQIGGTLRLSNEGPGGGGKAFLHVPDRALDWDGDGGSPCVAPDLSGLRLLVAEDNLTNQTILRQLLTKMQAEVVFVTDGEAALAKLQDETFDIALVDIEMPRKSGLEVMAAVRAMPGPLAQIPMVALTAYVLRDNREAIYAAGADGIIGKPVSSGAEFGKTILRYAGRPTGMPEPEDVLAGRMTDDGFGPKLDTERFNELMDVAGTEGQEELLLRLHEDLEAVCAALDKGVADQSVPDIRAQTHILIAVSGAVGAERLNRLTEVLNIAAKRKRLNDLAALYAPCRADLIDLIDYVAEQAERIGAPLRHRRG